MKILDVIQALEQEKVRYAVIGGIAVVLYGYVRFTKDIDLIIDFSADNVDRLVRAVSKLGFQPGVPANPHDLADPEKRREWMQEKNAVVITFHNPSQQLFQIDILLTRSLDEIKAVRHKIEDIEVSLIEYDDLIAMKKETGRSTDLIDIEKLEELKKGE